MSTLNDRINLISQVNWTQINVSKRNNKYIDHIGNIFI